MLVSPYHSLQTNTILLVSRNLWKPRLSTWKRDQRPPYIFFLILLPETYHFRYHLPFLITLKLHLGYIKAEKVKLNPVNSCEWVLITHVTVLLLYLLAPSYCQLEDVCLMGMVIIRKQSLYQTSLCKSDIFVQKYIKWQLFTSVSLTNRITEN